MNVGIMLIWVREKRLELCGLAVIYASLVPFVLAIDASIHGDVRIYYETTRALFTGELPYRDRTFEYPPYALLWFLAPALGGSLADFRFLFAIEVLVFDMLLKLFLLTEGLRRNRGMSGLLPVIAYSVGAGFLNFFYLQRMDLIPAALCLGAVLLFSRGRTVLSGLILALGVGTKLYPAVFFLPLWGLAAKRGKPGRFAIGFAMGLAPLLCLSAIVPWWRFLAFHGERGFEVESLYASALWFVQFFRDLNLEWAWVRAWQEVKGSAAALILPWAKMLMAGSVLFSSGLLAWIWRRRGSSIDNPVLSRALLLPLLPFVVFNIVLSPQYMIWLLVPAAAGLMSRAGEASSQSPPSWRWLWLIVAATAVTPLWYPSPQFSRGFDLWQTAVILGRNLALVLLWLHLLRRALLLSQSSCGFVRSGDDPLSVMDSGESLKGDGESASTSER